MMAGAGPVELLLLLALLLAGARPLQAAGPVVISEFLASNVGGLMDEDGDSPDWIELFNDSANAVSLAGWHLTDDAADLTKWTFPATNIGAKSFLIVLASGKDRAVAGAPLHANFTLDANGEYLALVQPDGVTLASEFVPSFPPQRANNPYGLSQTVTTNALLSALAPARIFVPSNNTLGLAWVSNAFDDSGWLLGTNGVGYETSVPGFAVRNFKANVVVGGLANADRSSIPRPSKRASLRRMQR